MKNVKKQRTKDEVNRCKEKIIEMIRKIGDSGEVEDEKFLKRIYISLKDYISDK